MEGLNILWWDGVGYHVRSGFTSSIVWFMLCEMRYIMNKSPVGTQLSRTGVGLSKNPSAKKIVVYGNRDEYRMDAIR